MNNLDEKQVVSINAVVYISNFSGDAPTPEFSVPSEYFSVILGVLKPAEIYDCSKMGSICCLQIKTLNERVIKIQVEWSGQNSPSYTVDGLCIHRPGPYCLLDGIGLDESLILCGMLSEIYREQKEQTKSKLLPFYIQELEWSTGRSEVRPGKKSGRERGKKEKEKNENGDTVRKSL